MPAPTDNMPVAVAGLRNPARLVERGMAASLSVGPSERFVQFSQTAPADRGAG